MKLLTASLAAIIVGATLAMPAVALAQGTITGLEFLNIAPNATIGDIIAALYVYGVGLVALAALVIFTIGGVMYIFAGDRDPSHAKEMMKNAFWGLVLALTSWLILYTINPELVKNIGDLNLQTIQTNPGAPPIGQQYMCSAEPGGYTSFETCKARCDALGGTCTLQNQQPPSANQPFCARAGIASLCQRMTVGACSNINGLSFQTESECMECVRRVNLPRGSLANCTR
ncbi:MAG: pilin [Patescibacteria group bacterium]